MYLQLLKIYLKGFVVGYIFSWIFVSGPAFIERYYPAAAPLAAALRWVGDEGTLGIAAASFFLWIAMFCLLVVDGWKFVGHLMSARASRGPTAVEEGFGPLAGGTSSTADASASTPVAMLGDIPPPSLPSLLYLLQERHHFSPPTPAR
ncbi:hypothetical protein MSAN_00842000 [Mycena sanguinolenta]|uniref:Uncharacterized protein n=1 Tax=Mycena sanguinolenta TaxID=230812 RepID=A0A8H7DA03_9AGAR|nr:hypothetical protein MSAN_00842000 [Mycena sanguinolenta]